MSEGKLSKNRIGFLDNAKALCMLYIVCFWHLQEYADFSFFTPFFHAVTRGVLATFFFVSAYLLGRKQICGFGEVKKFCLHRLLRIYPMFFIAASLFYLMNYFWGQSYILDTKQYIRTLLGISCIVTPAPSTLWFINMIFMFEVVAVIVKLFRRMSWKVLACSVALVMFLLLKMVFSNMDERIFLYYPIYCLGLLVPSNIVMSEKRVLLCGIIGSGVFGALFGFSDKNIIVNIVSILAFVVVLLSISKMLAKVKRVNDFFAVISYCSMCAYLFHRVYLYGIYRYSGVFSKGFAYSFVVPTFLLMSWAIQKMYDMLIHKVIKKM